MPSLPAVLKALFAIDGRERRIEVAESGRCGSVTYIEGSHRIHFYFEFGGGDCIAWMDVPGSARWESYTGVPLQRREEIVRFVAERVHRDHAGSARYEIKDGSVSFFAR